MATSPDYAILSAPRMSAAGFAAVLAGAHSPAAPEAAAAYSAFVSSGVDPAVALAIFRKESSFGTAGRAVANKSWGNIRGAAGYPTDDGGFRIYPSWAVGALDAARLMTVYGSNGIRPGVKTDTVLTLPYVWAPSSDGNAPAAYGAQLATWVGQYASAYPSGGGSGVIFANALNFADLVPPGTTVDSFKQAEVAAGLSTEDSYRLTQADADKLATALRWPAASKLASSINGLIYQSLGQPNSFFPGFTQAANQNVASAISGLADQLLTVGRNVVLFAALLGLVALGLYLTVRE